METPHTVVKRLNYLHVLHRLCIHKEIFDSGLHFGQPPILEYVENHEGCTQREISDFLGISPPSVATSVKRLQRAGFLQKQSDETDLRRTRLHLTDLGKQAAAQCASILDNMEQKLFHSFSGRELEQFSSYLDRMIDNLAEGDLKGESILSLMKKTKGMEIHALRNRRDQRHD